MIQTETRPTRLTRSRMLAAAGASLVGAAAQLWFPGRAEAAPTGCYGAPTCSCCTKSSCCFSGCSKKTGSCSGSGNCWTTCAYLGSTLVRFDCCDYKSSSVSICICSNNHRACT